MSSVLEKLRTGSDSTIMQVVFAAVVISFVGWGVGNKGGSQTDTVATVNGEAITGIDFAREYRAEEQRASQRSQGGLTDDMRAELREKVTEGLIRKHALAQEAHRLGLEVSTAEIAQSLLGFTFLLDDQKQFDKKAYEEYLRRIGQTRANFEESLRMELLIQKLQSLMMLGASVSEPAIERDWIESHTKVDITYVRVRASAFTDQITPDDATLTKYADEHKDTVQARYDQDFSRLYDKPELVSVRLIRLGVGQDGLGVAELKTRMEKAKAEIDAGADFGDVAKKWSEDPSAVEGGLQADLAVPQLATAVSDALRDLKPGDLSAILVGDSDVRLYKLESRTPAHTVAIDEVRKDIALALYRDEQAPAKAKEFAETTLLTQWKQTGAPPAAALEPLHLDIDTTGLVAVGDPGGLMAPPEDMMKAARDAAVGTVLDKAFERDGTYWVGAITNRQDADMSEFTRDAATIREQALWTQRGAFVQAWMADVVARAKVTK